MQADPQFACVGGWGRPVISRETSLSTSPAYNSVRGDTFGVQNAINGEGDRGVSIVNGPKHGHKPHKVAFEK